MSEVTINYKGSPVATMDASGLKTLLTQGKYLEDDVKIVYQRPSQSAPNLQTKNKTYTPTESQQTEQVRADSGYDGLDEVNVTVQPVSSSYVGSGVDRRDSTDLTQNGASVGVPAGYYEQPASKTIPNATRSNAITIGNDGLITNTHNILTEGYLPAGSQQYTRQLTTQGAQTIHPSTQDQTIQSGRYLTGAQTIKAVLLTNLLASIIKKDEVVKIGDDTDDDCVASITGTYEGDGGGGGGSVSLTDFLENNVTSIDLPDLTTLNHVFSFRMMPVTSVKLINVTAYNCGAGVFYQCANLRTVIMPKTASWSSNPSSTFYACPSLTAIDLGKWRFGGNDCNACSSLTTIILRSTTICALSATSAFRNSSLDSGGTGCTIYIPKVLYDELGTGSSLDYKAATNWSTIDGYGTITWAQIEGSQYENYYADGTPIT